MEPACIWGDAKKIMSQCTFAKKFQYERIKSWLIDILNFCTDKRSFA